MTTFTIILPTTGRSELLPVAVSSVQAQTLEDFELIIIGDGVDDLARETIANLAASDPRIRFLDMPKGPRRGEVHRHEALRNAQGHCVCYQTDDDWWLPDHLETMATLLADCDFAQCASLVVTAEGVPQPALLDINRAQDRYGLAHDGPGIGLARGGHTLAAYRRLPHGWRTTPDGIQTDRYMWLQFLEQPWCRTSSHPWPTVIQFPTPMRAGWSMEERASEFHAWAARLSDPATRERIIRDALTPVLRKRNRLAAHVDVLAGILCRYHGVRLGAQASAPAAGNPAEPPLRFAGGEAGEHLLIYGFSYPEAWGRWTVGTHAAFALPLRRGRASKVTIEADFFVDPQRHPQCQFAVQIDAGPVNDFAETKPNGSFTLTLPPGASDADEYCTVRLRVGNPASPRELGINDDPRRLGIGLREARFD